jgi:hypothetical protein
MEEIAMERQRVIKNMKLEILKSDYIGTTTYFYQKQMNMIFCFDWKSAVPFRPSDDEDKHLRELNNLPASFTQDV